MQPTDVDCREGLSATIAGSKTDQSQKGTSVHVAQVVQSLAICPVSTMRAYLQVRPPGTEDLLVHFSGIPLTRYQFQAVLKKAAAVLGWETTNYSSHSFRIGAATAAASHIFWVLEIT